MSANIEHALITRVLLDQDFGTLEKLQINDSFFTVPEMRELFCFLRDTYHNPNSPGLVPTIQMLQQYYPSFTPVHAPDPVALIANFLRHEKVRMDLDTLADQIKIDAAKDPSAALSRLKLGAQTITATAEVGHDLTLANAYQDLRSHYEMVANVGGMLGIPFPWDPLNIATQGMQNGQLIMLYGRPKSMKTWLALIIAVFAYARARRRVLFYTREMPPQMIAARAAAAIAAVDYASFRNGTLQPELRDYVFMLLRELMEDEKSAGAHGHQPCFVISSDNSRNGGGMTWLQSKIREIEPDLVVIDGMYLMMDERSGKKDNDWRQLTNITRDAHHTAMEFNIPVLGTWQANRDSEKSDGQSLSGIAYSDSVGQDCDIALHVRRTEKNDQSTGGVPKTELVVTAPAMREGKFGGMILNGEPATDFSYKRILTNEDVAEAETKQSYGKKKGEPQTQRPTGFSGIKMQQNEKDPKIPIIK